MKKVIFFLFSFCICAGTFYFNFSGPQKKLYIFDWYGMLDADICAQFEKETGIHIVCDVYSDNDSLLARLITGKSGYDVVFPSLFPYGVTMIKMGLLEPLDYSQFSLKEFSKTLLKLTSEYQKYIIPYYYGTIGIAYHKTRLKKILKEDFDLHHDSLSLIFDEKIVKKIAPYGISWLEEFVDIFPLFQIYMQHNTQAKAENFANLRSYIRKFSSAHFIQDLIQQNVLIALVFSNEALCASYEEDKDLVYVCPKEGSLLWIDGIALPKGSNTKHAYAFIRFLLRPSIAKRISANVYQATGIRASYPGLKHIKNMILSEKDFKKTILNHIDPPEAFEEKNRLWFQFRSKQKISSAALKNIFSN